MHDKPHNTGPLRHSLGLRISLSYSLFLLRHMLWQALVFSVVFWLCVCTSRYSAARDAAGAYAAPGDSLIAGRFDVRPSDLPLDEQPLFGRVDGALSMTVDVPVEGGKAYVAYALNAEIRLFRMLLITWALLEAIRIWILLKKGERISRRALRPITEIAETARRLSASNLSERIAVHGAKNELLDLSDVLNDMLDRIESAYNTQKQFVSDASHELRTPISVIQGYADMLDRWGKTDPEVRDESIAAIRSEAAGMKELVEQLLFIARHDSRGNQYEKIYFDASELAGEALRDTRLIAGKRIVTHGDMHRAIVFGDRAALKQALRIFIDNAIKYTPEGGTVTISCRKEEKFCRITVADTGMGVAEDELNRIFERFYRADQARSVRADGHGLGLSIARIIIRAHDGRIEVQSKKNVGSRFHILLPL